MFILDPFASLIGIASPSVNLSPLQFLRKRGRDQVLQRPLDSQVASKQYRS